MAIPPASKSGNASKVCAHAGTRRRFLFWLDTALEGAAEDFFEIVAAGLTGEGGAVTGREGAAAGRFTPSIARERFVPRKTYFMGFSPTTGFRIP